MQCASIPGNRRRQSGERHRPAQHHHHQACATIPRPPSSSQLLLRCAPLLAAAPAAARRPVVAAQAASDEQHPQQQQHSPPLLLAAPSLASVRDRLLRDELPRMFDPSVPPQRALSPDLYSESVVFSDPLASFAGFPLYSLNVAAIRAIFDVELVTHAAVVREAESSVVTRWTMTLKPRGVPDSLPFLTGKVRRPALAVTGTSAYGVDRLTGRVVSHVDTWDSLPMRRQPDALLRGARAPVGASALGGDGARFEGLGSDDEEDGGPSSALLLPPRPRGLLHVARRALRAALAVTPDLATPSYDVLVAAPSYEVRRYGGFALAEREMRPGSAPAGGEGFNELAGYIFGGNDEGRRWEMTTPVLTDAAGVDGGVDGGGRSARGAMAFVLDDGEEEAQRPEPALAVASFAAPKDPSVRTRVESGGRLWASIPVRGWPLQGDVSRAERRLRAAVSRDGLVRATQGPGAYRLLRYNDPLTPPQLRRSELLVEVEFCCGGVAGGRGEEEGGNEAAWAEALLGAGGRGGGGGRKN